MAKSEIEKLEDRVVCNPMMKIVKELKVLRERINTEIPDQYKEELSIEKRTRWIDYFLEDVGDGYISCIY